MRAVSSTSTPDSAPGLRRPGTVMRLSRMGSAHQCRLSFMRTLLRRLKQEQWQFKRSLWEIDDQAMGRAVYQVIGPSRTYSLVAFSHNLPDEQRSDRVIAQAWDATFCLFDGVPDEADLQRLMDNVPFQEAGRISSSELCLSRANRSVRLFDAAVDALAQGKQPDRQQIERVGYLMRTTAVYGSGKFGAADRELIEDREELSGPFQAEMLTVWLIRSFVVDLVEHMAALKGGEQAVTMEPQLRRCIGVGNSTGLGMAPFLVNHPTLLNNWIMAREQALSRIRAIDYAEEDALAKFKEILYRAKLNAQQWACEHPIMRPKLLALRNDLVLFEAYLNQFDFSICYPWDQLYRWSEQHLGTEAQEQLAMLFMEPYAQLVDELTQNMSADEQHLPLINTEMTVTQMRSLLNTHYAWALSVDYSQADNRSRFWYVSQEKLEPRLGERFFEPGAEHELPLCVSWHVSQLEQALADWPADARLANFLADYPQLRHITRRVQQIEQHPYMETRDNLIAADMMPIDLLRLKLSFFGAMKFDPRSDRWVRITLFQYAPFPDELAAMPEDDWVYPALNQSGI